MTDNSRPLIYSDVEIQKAIILRQVKEVTKGYSVQKDPKTAFIKAVTIFVSYLTAAAYDVAKTKGHRILTLDHITQALKDTGFADMHPNGRESDTWVQAIYRISQNAKKRKAKPATTTEAGDTDGSADSDSMDDEDAKASKDKEIEFNSEEEVADNAPMEDDEEEEIVIDDEGDEMRIMRDQSDMVTENEAEEMM